VTAYFGNGAFDEFLAHFFGADGTRRERQRVDITRLMTEPARELVALAARRAMEAGRPDVDTQDMLWAATQAETTRQMLASGGADVDALARELDRVAADEPARQEPPSLTPMAKRALLDAHQISRALGSSYIGPEHLLLALAANPEAEAGRLLARYRIGPEELRGGPRAARTAEPTRGPTQPGGDTPTLDQFGRDLTALAREGRVDPVVGREEQIEQTIEVLSRRTKNNPVLVGEAGVGKTAIVEGIAQRIVDGEVPDTVAGRRLIQLDLNGMVAGTRYRGDFEERLKQVIDEIREHSESLIVFIDELHTVVGAGASEGSMGAGNVLKPSLARGELHVIGATTLEEYRRHIAKDPALERRFQPILVPEPSVEDTVEILRGLRDRYEAHHQVRFTDAALVAAARLSDRYINDRFLPDKAIDLVDQAGARKRLSSRRPTADLRDLERQLEERVREKDQAVADERYELASSLRDEITELRERLAGARPQRPAGAVLEVGEADIAEVVARTTGIPASQLTVAEKQRLRDLESHLHGRVVGQDEAVRAVAEAIRRSRTGMGDPARPVGSFLFLGPTGVGKTELARALAETLFASEDRMIRLDMSEFGERHTASRLVGAPPGYVGYEEAGQLTEAVRRRPYSVVLLDEIEKAHPDVFNLLLQVLDDGRLTDGQGRTVDFRNTVLIMTSNLGSDLIASSTGGTLGFGAVGIPGTEQGDSSVRERVLRRLRESFRPEFLNRVDEIIVFHRLGDADLRSITELLLARTRARAHDQDIDLEFTPTAIDWLAQHGHEPQYGARPMRRTIQREVDNRLATLLLDGSLAPGTKITVDATDDDTGLALRVG
jgi:ATP-dependent Clp protease ATP-binding subunit ClpC